MKEPLRPHPVSENLHAFTRTEVIAISATVLLLIFFTLPSVAMNGGKSRSALCLSNLRHLISAWQLYADDNEGRLVGNFHGSAGYSPRNAPWALGWLDWTTRPDNTNTLFIREHRYARLGPYISAPRNVHKCPADNYQSFLQRDRALIRVRTVAMNATLGDGNELTGPWDPIYRRSRRLSDLTLPNPAETATIFDEHPDSINDPVFWAPTRTNWIDVPGNLHDGAGSFSFADGHVSLHPWRSTLRNQRVTRSGNVAGLQPGAADISWMSYSSQRSRDEHY